MFLRGAGSNPSSAAVFVCKGLKTKKLPLLGAFSTKMAGHSLLIANTMVHVTAWGFVAAVRLPMLGA